MWDRLTRIADCAATSYVPTWGDSDPLNLALLVGYVLATALAALIVIRRPFPADTRRREIVLWNLAFVVLALLALNKELDLQNWLTSTGRCVARAEGWYGDRRVVQKAFSIHVLIGIAIFGLLALLALRGTWARSALPFLGFALLFAFVGLRVISFHHIDHFFRIEFSTVRLHRIVEGSGLVLILFGQARLLRRPQA